MCRKHFGLHVITAILSLCVTLCHKAVLSMPDLAAHFIMKALQSANRPIGQSANEKQLQQALTQRSKSFVFHSVSCMLQPYCAVQTVKTGLQS